MTVKTWQLTLGGFVGLVIVAVLGGVAYHFLESGYESDQAALAYTQINSFLAERPCLDLGDIKEAYEFLQLARPGGIRFGLSADNLFQNATNWDIIGGLFLGFQLVGGVGYGNAPPQTTGGRVFCVFFTLAGLPLFVAAALGVGELLAKLANAMRRLLLVRILRRPASSVIDVAPTSSDWTRQKLVNTAVLFIVGSIFFLLIPAAIFNALETWTYGEALYCTIITTLTIGFADFVPGSLAPDSYRLAYRLLIGFWILGSLYWFAGVLQSVREVFRFDEEVKKPFGQDEPSLQIGGGQKKNRFDLKWKKKKSDKQRKSTNYQQQQQIAAISNIDIHPVYAPNRLYPAVVHNPYSFDSGPAVLTPTALPPGSMPTNNISRVTVGS